jgi:thioredoxin reductase
MTAAPLRAAALLCTIQTTLALSTCRPCAPQAAPLKWIIVGGGPHGVHIATALLQQVPGVTTDNLRIVDDGPELLHAWKTRTRDVGMSHLRSSASNHLDVREDALRKYAEKTCGRDCCRPGKKSVFASDYMRPRLDLFNDHCDDVVARHGLQAAHVRGVVSDIVPGAPSSLRVRRDDGLVDLRAENVVLALGGGAPAYPEWVCETAVSQGLIRHVFEKGSAGGNAVAIIGGGISAAHLALRHSRSGVKVHMVFRHDLREQSFDCHQDWMMTRDASERTGFIPERQLAFAGVESFDERRDIIRRERLAGTMPASVSRGRNGLRYAIESGAVLHHKADVERMVLDGDGVALKLTTGEIHVDRVLLATGFSKRPPGAGLVERMVRRGGLELCSCGYPAPDKYLRWGDVYVAGALAELELGPSARNIAGARLAAERIVEGALLKGRV